MSVATWLKSVFTTQTATNYKSNIDACFAVAERIVDNFAPRQSTTPAMTVTLDAGALYNGQILTEVATQTTGTITAPATNPRIDRVVINKTTGAVSVIIGTPAGSPVAPALTADVFPVAQVLLQTSSVTIVNSMITDERLSALTSIATHISVATYKATPVGADALGIRDSVTGLLNRLTLTNLAAYLAGLCSAGWNALTSSSCSGNALTSSSCSGNALTSSSCSGNSATATALAQGSRGYTLLAEAALSGTSVDLLGGASIPAWATKIYIMLDSLQTSISSQAIIQVGPSGGVVSTGYLGIIGSGTLLTNGLGISNPTATGQVFQGRGEMSLAVAASNKWSFASVVGRSEAPAVQATGIGTIALSGPLAKLVLTTRNGTDTLSGNVAIAYE